MSIFVFNYFKGIVVDELKLLTLNKHLFKIVKADLDSILTTFI